MNILYKKKCFTIILLFIIFVCLFIYKMKSNTEISVEEARYNYQKGLYDYVVDVRTENEWTQHHLPHTIHIPIGTLVTELPEKIPDTNARILFICKKGIRASAVTVIANKLGYYNVQSMIGNYKQLLL
jgi:phage shock protein E